MAFWTLQPLKLCYTRNSVVKKKIQDTQY